MSGAAELIFLAGAACLLLHELDAIRQGEWRFFLAWTGMGDAAAYRVFAAAHQPLFMLILAGLESPGFRIGLDLFLIGHAVAHTLLRNHPLIDFNSGFSRLWIYGAGALGAAHLGLMV